MKAIQKVIIIVYGLLVAVACIYVPWRTDFLTYNYSLSYSPIWMPLSFEKYKNESVVDLPRVLLEIIALTAIFTTLYALARNSEKGEDNEK